DVSKDRLDVHVMPSQEAFFVANDAAGVEKLAGRLAKLSPALVALEATGGFETLAAAGLAAAGLPVAVLNPAQVRSFADATGKRAKTDAIDAVIAGLAAACGVKAKGLVDEQTRLLADLVAKRRQITAMMWLRRRVLSAPPTVSSRRASPVVNPLATAGTELTAWRG